MVARLGAVRTSNMAQEVTGLGFGSLTAGYQTLLTVPAAELVAGHSYVAVITGTCGAFWHRTASNPWTTAELTAKLGPLYPWTGLVHSQDGRYARWQATWDQQNTRWVSGLRGHPFQIIYKFTAPNPSVDFEVVGRMRVNSATHPGGRFLVENLSATLWDVTEIGLQAGTDIFSASYAGAAIRIPYINQAMIRAITGTPGPAGTWLIYHSAFCTGSNPQSNDRIGLDNTASQFFNMPIGITAYGSTNPITNSLWQGQQGVRDLALNEQLSQWLWSLYQVGPPKGWYFAGEILAVRLHQDQQLFRYPTGKSTPLAFWDAAYQGTPLGPVDFSVSYSSDYIITGAAGTGNTNTGAATTIVEVDGGEFRPVQVHGAPGLGPVANVQICRVENPSAHHGVFKARLWGEAYWEDESRFNGQPGRDPQIYGFGMLIDYIPPVGVLITPGPDLPIVPGRETSLAAAALPVLPSAPSFAFSVDVQNELREFRTARGDQIVSPKFVKARRIFRFVWTGLTTVEGEALRDFFDGLRASSGGTFKWTFPGEFVETVFTLDADSFRTEPHRNQATYSVFFDALELVFVAP